MAHGFLTGGGRRDLLTVTKQKKNDKQKTPCSAIGDGAT